MNADIGFSFEPWLVLDSAIKLVVAFALSIPLGWERERRTRIMGMRTFPLVAVASCGYVLTATSFAADHPDALARVIQGLMTGIGFIGGGAILKNGTSVRGTATAASIWMTGALGAAVAFGQFWIALMLSAINFLMLWFITPLIDKEDDEA